MVDTTNRNPLSSVIGAWLVHIAGGAGVAASFPSISWPNVDMEAGEFHKSILDITVLIATSIGRLELFHQIIKLLF